MTLLPLTLGVRRSSGAGKAGQSSGPVSKKQTEKALRRDDYACRFCGFRAEKYQRAVPYAEAGDDPPVATACIFCEQCLMLERAGMMGSGTLIWLPEIGQAELNHIARAIYVAQADQDEDISGAATRALDALMARRGDAKKRLGNDDPLLLATVLQESLAPDEAKQAMGKLDGIRLFPFDKYPVRGPKGDVNHFPALVKYWRSAEGPFGKFLPEKWPAMFEAAMSAVGRA